MKILVTGGGGFIGSSLVRELQERGHEVIVLDDFSTGNRNNLLEKNKYICKVVEGSLLDSAKLEDLISQVDVVFHLAAVVGVRYALENTLKSLEVNIEGTRRVARYCSIYKKKLVFASSSSIYGKSVNDESFEKDDILICNTHQDSWVYSYGKIAGELYCRAMAKEGKLESKIIRFFNCVGERQTGAYGMVLPRFVQSATKGEKLVVYGDGSQTRTFIYVENLVKLLVDYTLESKSEWNAEACNIGGIEEISIKDLAEKVISIIGSTSEIEFIPFEKAFGKDFEETMIRKPNLDKLKSYVSLASGNFKLESIEWIIRKIYEDYCIRSASR